jgi:hypothetical protein
MAPVLVGLEPPDEPPHAAKMIAPASAANAPAVQILVFIALVLLRFAQELWAIAFAPTTGNFPPLG